MRRFTLILLIMLLVLILAGALSRLTRPEGGGPPTPGPTPGGSIPTAAP